MVLLVPTGIVTPCEWMVPVSANVNVTISGRTGALLNEGAPGRSGAHGSWLPIARRFDHVRCTV